MRFRNLFIDKVILVSNKFLTKLKTRARNYDEFIVFYYDFFERNPLLLDLGRVPQYDDIKTLFVFEKLSNRTFAKFIAEGQKRGHLVVIEELGIPDFSSFEELNGSVISVNEFIKEKFYRPTNTNYDETIYLMPIPDDLCEDYVKVTRKENRNKAFAKFKNNFSFAISLISAAFILYTFYLWIFEGIPPISNP